MNWKQLAVYGIVFIVIQTLISCGIFVTFADMAAYAAPKSDISTIHTQLTRIEEKLDKLIMGY